MTYLTLFPSHTRAMPRFSALASAILRQAEELQAVIPSMNRAYAIPTASGEALSAAGAALGIPRPPGMTDAAYRILLQTKTLLWTWDGTNNQLSTTVSNRSYYLRYASSAFSLSTTASSIYLYKKTIIQTEINPYAVTGVTVTPDSLDLYKGNSANLTAKVLPLTAADRSVSWSSDNTSVATVDAYGTVTAVAAGTATIRATANGDSSKYGECSVNVVSINKNLNAIIWDEEGQVFFSDFNANSLPTWNKLHNDAKGLELTNAFMANSSTLYAGTLVGGDVSTTLYTVNRSSYALTEYAQNYVGAFGMARASTRYTGYYVYGFAKYLIINVINIQFH